MEPAALIMSALLTGAKASLGRIADRTISGLYERLLEKIRGRLAVTFSEAKVAQSQRALMDPKALDDPDQDMEATLRMAKTHCDPEIVDLARQLMEALHARKAEAPKPRQQATTGTITAGDHSFVGNWNAPNASFGNITHNYYSKGKRGHQPEDTDN
jgi:hypothetical protein